MLYRVGDKICAIEVKAGATVTSDYFDALNRVAAILPDISGKAVVFGGSDRQSRSPGEVVPLVELGEALDDFDRRYT